MIIRRAPGDVFATLTDLDRLPEWATTVVETRDVSHPQLQSGCTFRQSFRALGKHVDSDWRVTDYQPPERVAYLATSPSGGRLAMTQTVTPDAAGSKVTFEVDYDLPGGLLGQAVDRAFVERRNEQEAERSLENLKRLLESPEEGSRQSTEPDRKDVGDDQSAA